MGHIISGIGKPTTTGKMERFWATYTLEGYGYDTLEYFLHCYNHIRPRQSSDCQTPAEHCGQSVPDVMTWNTRRTASHRFNYARMSQ